MSRGFRITAGVMTALFALSVVVQWNDPDPLAWMAIYGLAAVMSGLAAAGRVPLAPNAMALAIFVALTLLWVPSLVGARSEAFTSFRMKASGDEEPREAVGLLLCAGWSAVQTRVAWRGRGRR